MRVRITSLLLSLLLVGAAIAASPGGAERLDRELAAAPAATERLYLPSSIPLTRAISVAARSERLPGRIERNRGDAAHVRAFAERGRSFAPEPRASHDKRPLPRRVGGDPPQPD